MKKENTARHFITAFLIAAALYVVAYSWIEHRRNRKGPWQITFVGEKTAPEMLITQAWLGISNVAIVFPNGNLVSGNRKTNEAPSPALTTNARTSESTPSNFAPAIAETAEVPFTTVMTFAQPRPVPYPVPFGTCVFMDTTFLPGTVSFTNIFGHDIELLPRVLIIDRQEHAWKSGERIVLP